MTSWDVPPSFNRDHCKFGDPTGPWHPWGVIKGVLLDLSGAIYVGDRILPGALDVGAVGEAVIVGDDAEMNVAGALAAGLYYGVLVRTGKYVEGTQTSVDPRPSAIVDDLPTAVQWVLGKHVREAPKVALIRDWHSPTKSRIFIIIFVPK